MTIVATKIVHWCSGHRLLNHEGGCRYVHGHNYRAELTATAIALDDVGRVIDFGELKRIIGGWIDQHWDHAFLLSTDDVAGAELLRELEGREAYRIKVNPTAENIARTLLEIGRSLLDDADSGIMLKRVRVWETDTCYATAE